MRDMSPEDKWKVVVAQAPNIPWRSPPTSEPDGAVASTSANRDVPALSTSIRAESSSTRESGSILDALLVEFEPSSRIEGEEREGVGRNAQPPGGGRTKSVVTKKWRPPTSPPPPYDGEPRTQTLPSGLKGVEPPVSRPREVPRHIREQLESVNPLRPVESWPRFRGRRQRFNPRQVESQEEAQPPTPAIDPIEEGRSTDRRTRDIHPSRTTI